MRKRVMINGRIASKFLALQIDQIRLRSPIVEGSSLICGGTIGSESSDIRGLTVYRDDLMVQTRRRQSFFDFIAHQLPLMERQ
jgi:hypothetical protein